MVIRTGRLKGKELRKTQKQAKEAISRTSCRFIACNAPTGSGKSVIAIESMPRPLFYLCSSKQLQDQIQRDFPEAVILKGRENYPCPIFGDASMCFFDCGDFCEYRETKQKAMKAEITVLNFHYFLNYANFVKFRREEIRNVVIDEADAIEDVIVDFISFVIDENILERRRIKARPKKKTVITSVVDFLVEARNEVEKKIAAKKDEIARITESIKAKGFATKDELKQMRLHKWYTSFQWKCNFLLSQDLRKWVYYYDESRIYLKPKWLTRELMDLYLFNHGKKFLFMSATLPSYPVFCGLFGLGVDEVEYMEFNSEFPSSNRPVIFEPKWYLSRKAEVDESLIRQEVLNLLGKEKEKGIIHTVNYNLANLLTNLHPRLLIHNGENKERLFKEFVKSKDKVWVSPSSIRGIDLPDDLCRWILFLKAPFADLSDPVVSARAYSGKFGNLWYKAKCAQDIIQGSGRGVRNETDWCRTYIWDGKALDLITKSPSLFPMWFREAVKVIF